MRKHMYISLQLLHLCVLSILQVFLRAAKMPNICLSQVLAYLYCDQFQAVTRLMRLLRRLLISYAMWFLVSVLRFILLRKVPKA